VAQTLVEYFLIEVRVKADNHICADDKGRGSEITGGTKHGLNHLLTHLLAGCKTAYLFAFGDPELFGAVENFFRITGLKLLAGGNDFLNLNLIGRNKLFGANAGGSTFTMIMPLNFLCHNLIS
tara:strand:- start:374 stop:742 length:369 start_codon:yes stop_codon:yes gene_type:complete